jgi:thiosulfate reductase cytochrome b subunit
MVGSGWEIYGASPLFGFTFPQFITTGHWLGGAIVWHLAAMWLLASLIH